MNTRPNGLHGEFATVTHSATHDFGGKVERDPRDEPIAFALTPGERSKAAAATVHLEAWRRRQNGEAGEL